MWVRRLSWNPFPPISLVTDQELADLIATSLQDAAFFVDTSFLRGPLSSGVWDALSKRQVNVSEGVALELATWMASPQSDQTRNRQIVNAILRNDRGFIRPTFAPALSTSLWFGFKYYLQLLMLRKRAGKIFAEKFQAKQGRLPTTDEFFSGFKKQAHGLDDMAARIAWKGYTDHGKPNYDVDERIILQAIIHGLQTGQETVILTRDHDLLIQFYKAIFLLDTHYRSMLAADHIAKVPGRFRHFSFDELDAGFQPYFDRAFGGLSKSCWRPDVTLPEFVRLILPLEYRTVMLECWWFGQGPDKYQFSRQAFSAEDHMLQVFAQKAKGQGRNTSLFEQRNCHHWPVPWSGWPNPGIVVAEDQFKSVAGRDFRYLDVIHALQSNEGHIKIRGDKLPENLCPFPKWLPIL
jgi:hypothetical protein